ncbi:MAG: transporter permease [Clostridiales bacterium]|nr:transporter permease [Clostridiales bacterium]
MKNNVVGRSTLRVVRENIGIICLLILAIIGVVVMSLIPPQILKLIIDEHLVIKQYDGLIKLALFYMTILILIGLFDFIKEAVLTIVGQKITKEIRYSMMEKLERIRTNYFSSNESGTIVSRFTNDVEAINSLFTNGIIGMIIDLFKIVGILISIWLFSNKLGMITFVLIPLIYIIMRIFQKNMLVAQIKNRILIGKVNNHIPESLKNIQMIKSFSKEDYMEEKYKDYLLDNYASMEKVNFYDSVFSPIIIVIRAVVIASIVILSSKQLNMLGISLGMIAASIELISNLFSPIENFGMELQSVQLAISGVKRVNEFYYETEENNKDQSISFQLMGKDTRNFELQFHKVSFQYDKGPEILREVSFTIEHFEKVTFIGRTGAGKTTLFKLILGLLEPTSGKITINGIDVTTIPNNEKRKIFGYVEQSFHFIKGTVGEQISLRDTSLTRQAIIDAAKFVGIHEYIQALEKGYDTEVNSDDLFSQGQKQLLAIARAIVTNPPIILFDETTANLDSQTEEKILSVLTESSSNKMLLSISHRLSSMVNSDRLIILENGEIKSQGTPEQLIQEDEWYVKQSSDK